VQKVEGRPEQQLRRQLGLANHVSQRHLRLHHELRHRLPGGLHYALAQRPDRHAAGAGRGLRFEFPE
jgi:hypothetical protein